MQIKSCSNDETKAIPILPNLFSHLYTQPVCCVATSEESEPVMVRPSAVCWRYRHVQGAVKVWG